MAVALRGNHVPTGIQCIAERPDGSRFWFTPCPAAPGCMKIVARDGTLTFMNPPGLDMIGASSLEELAGKSIYEIIAPEDRDMFPGIQRAHLRRREGSLPRG